MMNISQDSRLINDLVKAYKLAGYEPGAEVNAATANTNAALDLPVTATAARDKAQVDMDTALTTGDLEAYLSARQREQTLSAVLTDGTLHQSVGKATSAQAVAYLHDYRDFGRAALVNAFNTEAEAFMDAYTSFSGDLMSVFGDPAQAALSATMQERATNLTVLRTANDHAARRGVIASIAHPVTGDTKHPDVISAEHVTRYLGNVAYPQPDTNIRQRPADKHYGPAAPWVQMLQQQAIARPNLSLTLRMVALDAQAAEMLALTERWTAAAAAAGQSNYLAPTAYGWKIPKADVDTAVAEARSRYEQAHSISA